MKKVPINISKIQKAKIIKTEDGFSLSFPKKIAQAMNLWDSNVFFVVTNGILQVSANEPKTAIPVLTLNDFKIPTEYEN